jgi:hypothetical protein
MSRSVVLVTGGARRIGRAIALDLAAAGWSVAISYRHSFDEAQDTLRQLRRNQWQAEALFADLSDEASCRALVPEVVKRFGRIDAVVNNASTFEYDNAETCGLAAMERHWKANTAPAILLAQALYQHLKDTDRTGCVVNLLDQKLWNPNPDYFSYTLSKAALEAATKMLASAMAPRVRVGGVAPGLTLLSGPMSEQEFEMGQRLNPMGRSSPPEDIADAVRFLLTFPGTTGSTILVDGGQHLNRQPRDVLFLAREMKSH